MTSGKDRIPAPNAFLWQLERPLIFLVLRDPRVNLPIVVLSLELLHRSQPTIDPTCSQTDAEREKDELGLSNRRGKLLSTPEN